MNSDDNNQEAVYCEDDGKYRVYCNFGEKLCIERFYKNHLKSGTHITNSRKKSNYLILQIEISSIDFIQIILEYYCHVCEKVLKLKSKNINLKSLTHIQYQECIRINHTIKSLDSFKTNYLLILSLITMKNFDLFLGKCDFKIDFKNFTPFFKTDFYHNTTIITLKRYLFYWIEYFTTRGDKFSHINEMNIKTINDKKYMNYEH